MKISSKLFLLILLLSVSSCSGLSGKAYYLAKREAAKSRPAYEQFVKLCSSESRSKIYKSVNTEGYISARTSGNDCDGGWDILLDQGYKYYECASGRALDYNSIIQGRIYRLEIEEKNDVECISWNDIEHDFVSSDKIKKYKSENQNKCFLKSEINEAKSHYVKLFEFGRVNNKGEHILEFPNDPNVKNLISFRGTYVIDLRTGKSLSIDRDYKYWPEGINNKAIGKYTCEEDEYIDELNVLIPKQ